MAPFISQQLIQHLVTSNPSPAYIERVAQVFENDGTGVSRKYAGRDHRHPDRPRSARGRSGPSAVTANFGHMREPILFMSDVLRGLNATLSRHQRRLQPARRTWARSCSTRPASSATSRRNRGPRRACSAPEFQIYSTQTAVDRADTVELADLRHARRRENGSVAVRQQRPDNTTDLLNYISNVFLHGSMSSGLETAATNAVARRCHAHRESAGGAVRGAHLQ